VSDGATAREIERYFDRLWPICRSLTGRGFRQSLDILGELVPWERHSFRTGERVLDWEIPDEWNPRAAWFVDPRGVRHADFAEHNLHLLGYSIPFDGTLPLAELKEHCHSLPSLPDAIPYVTSYYQRRWGFCLPHRELESLPDGDYQVHVDTELAPGELVIGEAVLPGASEREILFSSYLCHPSLANNELSGPLVLSFLYRRLAQAPRRFTYRFVVVPETIGAIAFLSLRGEHLRRTLLAGYQLTCIGDGGAFTYKRSRDGATIADRAALAVLGRRPGTRVFDFNPAVGSDERQYCSPGFNLPVGSIMRTMYTLYPEYHTSLDDKRLMDFAGMAEATEAIAEVTRAIEENRLWRSLSPLGEPQLGRRGLFRSLSTRDREEEELAMWWILNLADGAHDLLAMCERGGLQPDAAARVAQRLAEAGLLEPVA